MSGTTSKLDPLRGAATRRRLAGGVLTAGYVALALLAGCGDGDGPGGPTPLLPSGSLQFAYSGAESGSFQASGEVVWDQAGPGFGTWAYGVYSQADQALGIVGFHAQSPPRGDTFVLALDGATGTGSFPIDGEACFEGTADQCGVGWLAFDVSVTETGAPVEEAYVMLDGTVTVSSRTSDRVAGSFSGTAVHMTDHVTEAPDPRSIQISNGSFDVPLLHD